MQRATMEDSEAIAKKAFRHAWEYSQKIERATKSCQHTQDLFSRNLLGLRNKLMEKCVEVILSGPAYSRKGEELLWKRAMYDVVQRCKQSRQLYEGSLLHSAYQHHLSTSLHCYQQLSADLERKFGQSAASITALQDAGSLESQFDWLKELHYTILLRQGDLARYQSDLRAGAIGDSSGDARTFYEQAISLDPSQGRGYNQLAALAGDKNEALDAIYYYQQSLVSACPYQHSLANLQKIYEKNNEKFESLKINSRHLLEPSIREESRRMVLVQFIQLQQLLSPHDSSGSGKVAAGGGSRLTKLCEKVTSGLADCLNYDLILYQESWSDKVWKELGAELPQTPPIINLACFSDEDLLKLSALSILPSYSLRSLGSTHTKIASEFALSVFSLLLSLSFKRVTSLLFSYLRERTASQDEVESMLQANASLNQILLRTESQQSLTTSPKSVQKIERGSAKVEGVARSRVGGGGVDTTAKQKDNYRRPISMTTTTGAVGRKRTNQKVVDRRRRRGQRLSSGSSEESEGEEGERGRSRDSSSDSSLSMPSDGESGEDIQVLESLSDSSASEDDQPLRPPQPQQRNSIQDNSQAVTNQITSSPGSFHLVGVTNQASRQDTNSTSSTPAIDSGKASQRGRRQIVLAASFNLAPPSSSAAVDDAPASDVPNTAKITSSSGASLAQARTIGDSCDAGEDGDRLLKEVYCDAVESSCVHTACSILAEDGYLTNIKVFADWLQAYSIVLASASKQISSSLWSNLASVLNLLPTEDQLLRSKFPLEKEGVDLGLAALPEDGILKGLPPLLEAQKGRSRVHLLRLEQTVSRILTLLKFGHFISDLPTAPQFSWDSSIAKFIGPAQKSNLEKAESEAAKLEEEKLAKLTRSKLMKTMAQQRLKSEVASLAVAKASTSAVFTPYIIPDAHALCTGLHLIKKMIRSEKFLFIIPMAVIECLDQMKKGRENYSAREAIKFLESQLQSGSKFMKAQKPTETLVQQGRTRKPAKMDIKVWWYQNLVDCGLYWSDQCGLSGELSDATVTLLVDKQLMELLKGGERGKSEQQAEIVKTLEHGEERGLEVDSVLTFYSKWQKQSQKK